MIHININQKFIIGIVGKPQIANRNCVIRHPMAKAAPDIVPDSTKGRICSPLAPASVRDEVAGDLDGVAKSVCLDGTAMDSLCNVFHVFD